MAHLLMDHITDICDSIPGFIDLANMSDTEIKENALNEVKLWIRIGSIQSKCSKQRYTIHLFYFCVIQIVS